MDPMQDLSASRLGHYRHPMSLMQAIVGEMCHRGRKNSVAEGMVFAMINVQSERFDLTHMDSPLILLSIFSANILP
jgi:hypothetical protein